MDRILQICILENCSPLSLFSNGIKFINFGLKKLVIRFFKQCRAKLEKILFPNVCMLTDFLEFISLHFLVCFDESLAQSCAINLVELLWTDL